MINSRQELSEYALRQLGGGVVNIELTSEQMSDGVQDAIDYYHEYHFDGIERDFLVRKITGTKFTVASVTGLSVGDTISCEAKNIFAEIYNITGSVVTVYRTQGEAGVVFANTDTVTNGTVTTTISAVTLGDADNGYIPVDEFVMGVVSVMNAPFLTGGFQGADLLFSANYQLMAGQVQSLISSGGNLQAYVGTMTYLSELEFILKKQKSFRFNRRMDRIYLDVNWDVDMAVGNYITIEVYRALDDDTYSDMLNDIWLKRYTTALFKKTWGTNLKKYTGMQLPGGLTYNGQQIYDEALTEIDKLEQEAINSSAPLNFSVG